MGFFSAFHELFLTKRTGKLGGVKFALHRINGILYLMQYVASFLLMVFNYDAYTRTPLPWTLPLCGWIQAVIASFTFTFLPKGNDAQGYYSDKRTITYSFMVENVYFSGLLLFQALYGFTPFIKSLPFWVEHIGVFLPYVIFRPLFPKTSLGDSRHTENQYSSKNMRFLKAMALISKIFYVWAKHFVGYYMNYMIYLGLVQEKNMYHFHWLLLVSGWATTIAVFLHTLKFKGYIGPRFALLAYTGTFPAIVSLLATLQIQFGWQYFWVSLVVLLGVPINFIRPTKYWNPQYIYQFVAMAYLANMVFQLEDSQLIDKRINATGVLFTEAPFPFHYIISQ